MRGSWGPGKNSLGPFLSIFLSFSSRRAVPVSEPGSPEAAFLGMDDQ